MTSAISPNVAIGSPALPGVVGTAEPSRRFAQLLDDEQNAQQPDRLRDAAAELVSVAFLMPLMKMARQDPFRTDLFHGGQGEEAFGAQLDQRLADEMARSMKLPMVDAIYGRFAAGAGKEVGRG